MVHRKLWFNKPLVAKNSGCNGLQQKREETTFPKSTKQAIPVAARIARAYEGSVVLLPVVHPPVEHEAYLPEHTALTQTDLDAALTQAADYLKGITYWNDLADTETDIQVHVGSPASTILAFAEHWTAHSTAEAVLGPTAYLVAALTAPSQGALYLVQVVDLPPHLARLRSQAYTVSIIEQAGLETKGYLRGIADRFFQSPLADLHLAVTESVVSDPDVAATLIKEAEDNQEVDRSGVIHRCELIAMATHGRGGLQRWATGSVIERVLHATKLPLLVVRPKKEAAPESKRAKTAKSISPAERATRIS